jgi:hypothetical protein
MFSFSIGTAFGGVSQWKPIDHDKYKINMTSGEIAATRMQGIATASTTSKRKTLKDITG